MSTKKNIDKNEKQNYPIAEDIYNKCKKEQDINPEDIFKLKTPNKKVKSKNENNFDSNEFGSDLDIPGAELDDDEEKIGSEDEENNSYSIGADRHSDLDEN